MNSTAGRTWVMGEERNRLAGWRSEAWQSMVWSGDGWSTRSSGRTERLSSEAGRGAGTTDADGSFPPHPHSLYDGTTVHRSIRPLPRKPRKLAMHVRGRTQPGIGPGNWARHVHGRQAPAPGNWPGTFGAAPGPHPRKLARHVRGRARPPPPETGQARSGPRQAPAPGNWPGTFGAAPGPRPGKLARHVQGPPGPRPRPGIGPGTFRARHVRGRDVHGRAPPGELGWELGQACSLRIGTLSTKMTARLGRPGDSPTERFAVRIVICASSTPRRLVVACKVVPVADGIAAG